MIVRISFVFKARQQAHSRPGLCNCCRNAENGRLGKSDEEVIWVAFPRVALRSCFKTPQLARYGVINRFEMLIDSHRKLRFLFD